MTLLKQGGEAARLLNPSGWSKRTMLMITMQAIDTSIRLKPLRRRRDGSILLATVVAPGSVRPAPIPAAYDVANRIAEKIGGTAQASMLEATMATPVTAHFLGGAVIADGPESGVVDSDHRVFGYENLMVCDGSVLPANIGVNPSLTISALTERAISKVPVKSASDLISAA